MDIKLTNGLHISEKSLIDKLATQVFVETSYETTNGTGYIYFDELEDKYELPKYFINGDFANKIVDKVNKLYGKMVAELEVLWVEMQGCFSVTLYHDFAIGYIEDDQAILENRRDWFIKGGN